MNKSGRLLVASILAVALMAPPAYPQNRSDKQILQDLERDVVMLTTAFGDMRDNTIARNEETKKLLEQILARFGTIDASIQKLETSLAAIKASDEASARGLQQANTAITELKRGVDASNLKLGETLTNLTSQMSGVTNEVNKLRNAPAPLPGAEEAFNSAYLAMLQGEDDIAISGFRDFLNSHATDPRAPKAQLYIGNAYFNQKKFDLALIEYDLAIGKNPETGTKCTALYKKGLTHVELKQTAPARTAFETVVKDCADTPEHPLAQERLRPAGRGGRGA